MLVRTGGLYAIALKASTPNIPRLLIVNPPPWMSAGRSRPAWARLTTVLAAGRELREAQRVGAVDDGDDEAGIDGHGQADRDVGGHALGHHAPDRADPGSRDPRRGRRRRTLDRG
jgi:hypothetical protein